MTKIQSIENTGRVENCQCISVSDNLHLYKTDDNIITHNTIVSSVMSELGWFEEAGWTKEKILEFYTRTVERIGSRMHGNYFGRSIIDSSPFSMESPVDNFIYTKAQSQMKNFIITGSRWKYYPGEFPEFIKNGKEVHNYEVGFEVFKGGKNKPPLVLNSEAEGAMYDAVEKIWCPRKQITRQGVFNYYDLAINDPVNFLRNQAGLPAGSADRLFPDVTIIESIFDNDLKNQYGVITASAKAEPESLIWDQIKNDYFNYIGGQYLFYREPNVKRVISVDQSVSGDATAISMSHLEYEPSATPGDENKSIVVVDFTIVIIPGGGQINLEAIKCFIIDLVEKGNINLGHVSFDQFQSVSTQQALKRKGYQVEYISVDKYNAPYQSMIDLIMHRRLKAGKSLPFKNCLRSLHVAKRDSGSWKYDHFNGPVIMESDDMNWETSTIFLNSKDAADTVAANVELLNRFQLDYTPYIQWKPDHKACAEVVNQDLAAFGLKLN